MLLIECKDVKKYFGDRILLDIENLKVYAADRIGIVGVNGAGKTTLMHILTKRLRPDEGWVKGYERHAYISQLEKPERESLDREMASKFGISDSWQERMSGGEKTRFKLAAAFSENMDLIFADEPTSNLDMEGIELLERMLEEYKGALILISHDRSFLDKLCTQIWEIENGKVKVYKGNYSDYCILKSEERTRKAFEYEAYVKEKKRLEEAIGQTKEKAKGIKKAPKRMGNSEARLHKMGDQKSKANLDRAVKRMASRIVHLEVKEKPIKQEGIKLDMEDIHKLHSKIIIEGEHIHKAFGEKLLFKNGAFSIYNGAKVGLIGPNGCGKSTLIKMIINQDPSIKLSKGAKIGYFSQDMNILKENLTILENVLEDSAYPQSFARTLLARLLIKGEDVHKKIHLLSGGERVKVSFAKILLQDIHLLILDEPTNYMDVNALEVIEDALKDYDRTLLFVSHDRKFVRALADHIMTIENHDIKMFKGSYAAYIESRNKIVERGKKEIEKEILILQNRLSEVLGKLSIPAKKDDPVALDKEYHEILGRLNRLKSSL
ncbi:MAG: ribosomal protection-like ABC-F family protein [Thermotaleaceae bacterium]